MSDENNTGSQSTGNTLTGSTGASSSGVSMAPNSNTAASTPVKDLWSGTPGWVKQTEQQTPEQQSTTPEQAQQTAQVSIPQAQPPAVDPQLIATAVREGVSSLLPALQGQPVQQPQQQVLTQEQIDQHLSVFKVDDSVYESILGVKPDRPERVAAMNDFVQRIVKQAVTTAHILQQGALAEMNKSMNPYITAVRQQEAERQKTAFFAENADLKGYEPLVKTVFDNALAQGKTFASVEEARKFVAETTRGLLKATGVTPGTSRTTTSTSGATPQTGQTRQMTTTSVGGRTGSPGNTSSTSNTVKAVWG